MAKRGWAWALTAALLVSVLALAAPALASDGIAASHTPSYSEFLRDVRQGRVESVQIEGRWAHVSYKDGSLATLILPESDASLPGLLDQYGVEMEYQLPQTSIWPTLLPFLLVFGVLAAIVIVQVRRQSSGGGTPGRVATGPGRSGARLIKPGQLQVTFADVAGQDEVKADLQELVDFLMHPDRYKAMGARIPKGILLYGPPGTGKTLLARAVAGEAGVSFIHFSASQFVEMFVGVGASRVRDLFALARKHAPCIVFIDELDAVGRHRGTSLGGNDEREQTLNQLLVEMDGFEMADGIVVMAATNRPDILDKALLRPGRFDRQIPVDVPDLAGRRAILAVHAKGKTFAKGVNLEIIARRTPGFTGADLANILNEAALLAVRRQLTAITMAEVDEAIDRVMAGGPAKQGRLITPAEKERIAIHEAGHALAARLQPNPDPVHKVTVIPRGKAGGFTLTMPEEEKILFTRSELMKRLVMLLAGRAAEELLLGEVSTGAQNDLERAYQMARQMVARFGMSENVGPVGLPLESQGFERGFSEELAAQVDREARKILGEAAEKARAVLEAHRAKLGRVAASLVEKETLDGRELDLLLGLATEGGTHQPLAEAAG